MSDFVDFDDGKAGHILKRTCMYHDPKENVTMWSPTSIVACAISFYLLPQEPSLALKIWVGLRSSLKLDDESAPLPVSIRTDARVLILPLVLAIEFDDAVCEKKLRAALASLVQGRFFNADEKLSRERAGDDDDDDDDDAYSDTSSGDGGPDFGYFFHLDERWPRGQLSALLSCVDVLNPGSWQRAFRNASDRSRFTSAPRVTNVSWPDIAVTRAYNANGALFVSLISFERHCTTTFVVDNLGDLSTVAVERDGEIHTDWAVLDTNRIRVSTRIELDMEVHFRISGTKYDATACERVWKPFSIEDARRNAML